jgi:alkylation response protein AidB-like acyl-CoA dehydrogenase
LGKIGEGLKVAFSSLDNGRIGIAALSVGIAQAALEESAKYAKDRMAFGRPIAEFQAIQQKLANMSTEVEAARTFDITSGFYERRGRQTNGKLRFDGETFCFRNCQ